MPTRTPVSLADLARSFAKLQPEDAATRRRIAALLGFEAALPVEPVKPGPASEPSRPVPPISTPRTVVEPSPFDASGEEALEQAPRRDRPTTGSTLSFDLDGPIEGTPSGSPEDKPEWWEKITVLSKPVDPARIPPPAPLLLPIWSRTTYMRALSTLVREGRLDISHLVDLVARLEVPVALPRLPWSTMRRGVQLLVDDGDAMMTFRDDQQRLVREIQELVGSSAFFEVYFFWGTPVRRSSVQVVRPTIPGQEPLLDPATYHLPPAGTPILALTDLGIGALAAGQAYVPPQEWQAFARSAEAAGCPLTAFVPYHPDRCPESLRREMRIIHWHHARGDSGARPTALQDGSGAARRLLRYLRQRDPQAVTLAHLASLASRVELSLLRELRLRLLPDADGGTEADLWFSRLASMRSETALLLRPKVAEALRSSLFQADPVLFDKAWDIVQDFRAQTGAFEGTRLEEEINYWLAQGARPDDEKIRDLLRRAVKTVYKLGTEDEEGLALWSVELLNTLPQEARDTEAGRDLGTAASFRLDPNYVPAGALPDDISGRQWLIPVEAANLPSVSLWVGREPEGLVLADREDLISGAKELKPVPATTPVVVWLSWNDGQDRKKVVITPGVKAGPIDTGDHQVTIETFAGTSWKLTPSTVAAERLSPGNIFADRYEVFEELGPDLLTDRYHARDVSSGEEVILAVGRDVPDAAEYPERFEREASVFSRLEHPGLVRVLDYGVVEGRSYLVREQIGDEETLRDRLVRGRLPLDEALPILTQVASALAHLHTQDPPVLYLHLEPFHVLLEGNGDTLRAVLTDAVAARAWQASSDGRVAAPGYVSPEQASGAPPSPQSDVYGLGLLAYEMLAGRPPFSGDDAALLKAHVEESPRPLQELVPELRENASAAVLKALAKDPGERYPSAGAFVAAFLEAAKEEQPPDSGEPLPEGFKIVVSDLHLGAGSYGGRNPLEDFDSDPAFAELLDEIIAESERDGMAVELILNGDTFEMLQVPHEETFDPAEEYPPERYHSSSEADSILKMNIIIDGHPTFFEALGSFIHVGPPRRSVTLIKGNRDVNIHWPGVQDRIRQAVGATSERMPLLTFEKRRVSREGIYVEHGNQYTESADRFDDMEEPYDRDNPGQLALPPSSYFVMDVLNKMEREKYWIDNVKPITALVWYALSFDFGFAVRAIAQLSGSLPGLVWDGLRTAETPSAEATQRELEDATEVEAIAERYETDADFRTRFNTEQAALLGEQAEGALRSAQSTGDPVAMGDQVREQVNSSLQATAARLAAEQRAQLVVFGHTHDASVVPLPDGGVYINSGTWTWHADFGDRDKETWRDLFEHPERFATDRMLTYVRVDYDEDGQPNGQLLVFEPSSEAAAAGPREEGETTAQETSEPDSAFTVAPRVLVLNFAPIIRAEKGRALRHVLGWNDPRKLAEEYIADLAECSGGYLRYQLAEWRDLDAWPVKEDGFRYDEESFLRAWRARTGFHQPDSADYEALLEEHDILKEVDAGRVDEVWLFCFPYAGFYESIMIGPGAQWCNAPPLVRSDVSRRFMIMAFSYERGVGPMLESFGHRVESLLKHEWQDVSGEDNLWERFSRYDKIAPGQAGCGTMHYAPNSAADYDWGNTRKVPSTCDDWLEFPNLQGLVREVDCSEWGNGDLRAHHEWWLRHLPCAPGETNGKLNNWWAYAVGDSAVEAMQAEDVTTPVLDELLATLAKNAPSRALGFLRRGREEEKAVRRRRLVALLGETGDPRAVSVVLDHLQEDPDRIVRRVAAQALGELGDAQAVEALIVALRDEDSDVRAQAARTLGSLGDVRAAEPLIAALGDEDSDVRAAAARVLGSLGDVRAVERLREAAADPDPGVQMAAADALRQLQPEPGPGTIFAGKYEIAEQLVSGGLTARYQARDVRSGQQVRLTLVPEPPDDAGFPERFEREASTFARLEHPGLVRILDYGVEAGRPYLVKEWVGDERTLRDLLTERRSLSPEQALPILSQVASALDYLHSQDPPILHLHLKPSHVLLEGEGDSTRAVLADSVTTRAWQAVSDEYMVGAPAYLSPEQAGGAPVSPQTDVYGLGLLAYEMLAGRPPFTGDAAALLKAHAEEPPRPPQEFAQALSDNASEAILKALAKYPDERFASAGAFVAALRVKEGYRNFDLEVFDYQEDAGGERFSVRVADSPAGSQWTGDAEQVSIPPRLRPELRMLESRKLDPEEMIELGQQLAELLFPYPARQLLDRSRAMLNAQERLRIRLEIDDQRLANIPWEYLYVPGPGVPTERPGPAGFLALDRRVSLVRYEAMGQLAASLEPVGVGPLRLTVLFADPNYLPDYPPLYLGAERKVIESALSDVPEIDVQFFSGGRLIDLEEAIETGAHIFHFDGHGGFSSTTGYDPGDVYSEEAVALVGQDGGVELFPAVKLALNLANRGIRLVVLGAGETRRQDGFNVWTGVASALIRAGIPAVVALQHTIRDTNAVAFSRQFYRALADGRTVDEAVALGRLAIFNRIDRDDRDWGVPVLYLRTPGAVLFPGAEPFLEEPEM